MSLILHEINLNNSTYIYPEMINRQNMWSILTRFFYNSFLIAAPLNLYGLGSGIFNYRFSRILILLTLFSMFIDSTIKNKIIYLKIDIFDILIFTYLIFATFSGVYVKNYTAFFIRLFGLIECILIYYVVRLQTSNIHCLIRSIKVYILSSGMVIFASFYQLYGILKNSEEVFLPLRFFLLSKSYENILGEVGHFGGFSGNFTRIFSTFGEPNMLAGYCASIIPFMIALVLFKLSYKKIYHAIFYIFLGLFTMLSMITSVSKSGLISTFFGIFIMVLLTYNSLNTKQKRILKFFCILSFTAAIIYVIFAKDIFIQRFELGDSGHIQYRLVALNTFLENPLLGVGFGNYEFISAHTLPLTALIELGIFGGAIVFFISILPLFSFNHKTRNFLKQTNTNYLLFYSACYSSYFSIFIGLYFYDYWMHPFTWISMGFIISIKSHILKIRT